MLRSYPFGEADRVVVLLSPNHGKLRTVAKGVRKTKSRFGGRLEPDATGFPARAMAKTTAGDWRDRASVRHWAAGVAADLADLEPMAGAR